jgi:hypothetical protein
LRCRRAYFADSVHPVRAFRTPPTLGSRVAAGFGELYPWGHLLGGVGPALSGQR